VLCVPGAKSYQQSAVLTALLVLFVTVLQAALGGAALLL